MIKEKTILLVEDSLDDQDLVQRAFKKNGILNRINVVQDGEEALDFLFCKGQYGHRAHEKLPSLVLLDLNLPKLNGIEVLEQIRNNPDTSLIPVVILTSSKEEEDIIKGYKSGANSYLAKPINFMKLQEIIQNVGLYWMITNVPPPDIRF